MAGKHAGPSRDTEPAPPPKKEGGGKHEKK
ncbi:hypothetical protein CLV72_105208 [Allonocardiopsis opalescens]|uniref:Uncharacterized protein n=1 Tax=Allonocardiopsis opalescens TaxID=1144618 RepID=A0A2T0Q2G6_9ACTN|nr:hypothetical protein CLV72_105208 [Allonocardiopsis opalescens]